MSKFSKTPKFEEALTFQKIENNSTKSCFQVVNTGKFQIKEDELRKITKDDSIRHENENKNMKIKIEYKQYVRKAREKRQKQRDLIGQNQKKKLLERDDQIQRTRNETPEKRRTKRTSEKSVKSKRTEASGSQKIYKIDQRKNPKPKYKEFNTKKENLSTRKHSEKKKTLEVKSSTTNDELREKLPPKKESFFWSRKTSFEISKKKSNFLSQVTASDSEKVFYKPEDARVCFIRSNRRTKSNSRLNKQLKKSTQDKESILGDNWVNLPKKCKRQFGLNLESSCLKVVPTILISNSTEMVVLKDLKLSTAEFDFTLQKIKKLIFGVMEKLSKIADDFGKSDFNKYYFVGLNEQTRLKTIKSEHVLWLHRTKETRRPSEKDIFVNDSLECGIRKTINLRMGDESLQIYSSPPKQDSETVFLTDFNSGYKKTKNNYVKVDVCSEFNRVKLSRNKKEQLQKLKSKLSADKTVDFQMREFQLLPDSKIFWRVFHKYFGKWDAGHSNLKLNDFRFFALANSNIPAEFESIKSAPNLNKWIYKSLNLKNAAQIENPDCDIYFFRFGRKQIKKFKTKIKMLYRIRKKISNYSQIKASLFSAFILHKSKSKIENKFEIKKPIKIDLFGNGIQKVVQKKKPNRILQEESVDFEKTHTNLIQLSRTRTFLKLNSKSRKLTIYKKLFFFNKTLLSVNFSDVIAVHRSKLSIMFLFR